MKRRRHTPEQIVRKLQGGRSAAGRGAGAAGGREAVGGVGGDVSPLAGAVRRDEGRRRQAAEGARAREREVEADRGRSDARGRGAEGDLEGKLVSPSRRRQAVRMLQDRLGLSERRACRYVGQHRSTQRHEPVVAGDDAGVAGGAAADLPPAAAVGVPPRASAAARRGLGAEPQADAAAVARGGAAGAAAAAQAPAARGLDRPGRAAAGRGARITCGRSTSSSIRPPTGTS